MDPLTSIGPIILVQRQDTSDSILRTLYFHFRAQISDDRYLRPYLDLTSGFTYKDRILRFTRPYTLFLTYVLRNYGADWSWCFFGRELVAYSNITSVAFFDEISKKFPKSIRAKIRKNIGFTPMPKMDGHVANYPVAGKTGCPVIISKYPESEKIKVRVKDFTGFLTFKVI